MKKVQKKQPVKTTPKGVWEASHTDATEGKTTKDSSNTVDLQGNGYPKNKTQNESLA